MMARINRADVSEVGVHGVVYVCGSLTSGRVSLRQELLGKGIRGIFGAHGQFLAVVDEWELDWQHSRDRSQVLEQETVTLGFKADVNVRQVAFGKHHRVAVTHDGQLFSWGSREAVLTQGELGQVASSWHPITLSSKRGADVSKLDASNNREPQDTDFESRDESLSRLTNSVCLPRRVHAPRDLTFAIVACGAQHSVAITDKGDMYAWGRNFEGQLGLGSTTLPTNVDRAHNGICARPKYVSAFLKQPPVVAASCGDHFTVALLADGSVWRFGERTAGITHHPEEKMSAKPQQLLRGGSDGAPCTSIACGAAHALATTKSGELLTWGLNSHGQLGLGTGDSRETPRTVVSPPVLWKQVFAGSHYSAAITSDGELFTWGNGHHGQLGHESTASQFAPRAVAALRGVSISSVVCGQHNLFALAPTIVTSVLPRAGEVAGGYELRISGSGFWNSDNLTVRFAPLTDGRLVRGALARYDEASQQVVCTVPKFSLPGEFAVEVATDGKHFTSDGHVFEVFKRPVIASVSKWEARSTGGEALSIRIDGDVPRSCSHPILVFVSVTEPAVRIQVTGTVERVEMATPREEEDEETPAMAASTTLHFITPPFPASNTAVHVCQLELSFNDGFVFTPVHVDSTVPFKFTFHEACVMRSTPNSFNTRQLPTELTWTVHHLLVRSVEEVSVTLTVSDLSVSDNNADCRVQVTLPIKSVDIEHGMITCTIPELSSWRLSKLDAKTGDRVEITTDWWKFVARWGFEASVAISTNGARSVLPAHSKHAGGSVFGVLSTGKVLTTSPAATLHSGGTVVAVASDYFHFDSDDAAVFLTWRDREIVVPAKCSVPAASTDGINSAVPASSRRVVFTTPPLPFPPSPVQSEDQSPSSESTEQEVTIALEPAEVVSAFVSLDGQVFQRDSSVRIMYYRMPELSEIHPSEAVPGSRMTIKLAAQLPAMSVAPTTACVRLTTATLGLITVVPVELMDAATTIEFDLPTLPVTGEDTIHIAFSIDGQQFTVEPLPSTASGDNARAPALAFRYQTPALPFSEVDVAEI